MKTRLVEQQKIPWVFVVESPNDVAPLYFSKLGHRLRSTSGLVDIPRSTLKNKGYSHFGGGLKW